MNILTLTVTVSAPRNAVFNFLADIENLPKWAGGYCEGITLQRGRWWALTADGEQVVDLESSAGTGVIDLRAGPLPEHMTLTPIRVLPLSMRDTLITFVLIEAPDSGPGIFERRCRIWCEAVKGLPRRFGGGELHSADPTPQLMELGLN
jgi:hypothetical protein